MGYFWAAVTVGRLSPTDCDRCTVAFATDKCGKVATVYRFLVLAKRASMAESVCSPPGLSIAYCWASMDHHADTFPMFITG